MTEWQYQVRFDVKDAATAESVRHGQPYLALAPSIAKGTARHRLASYDRLKEL